MRMNGVVLVPVTLLVTAACAGFPFARRAAPEPVGTDAGSADPAPRIELELRSIRYDGRDLFGQLLLSPREEAIRFDKRLIESIALSVEDVRDCATGQPLEYLIVDVLAHRTREEDWLVLQPGYWYGKDVRIPLFDVRLNGEQGPECIDVRLAFHALRGRPFPVLQVRATKGPQAGVDAGALSAPHP